MNDQDKPIDVLIIGAGLAGLHSALRISRHPSYTDKRIVLAEAYNYIGGRVVSFSPRQEGLEGLTWENGAGRIHNSHKMVLSYLKKYDIPTFPIKGDSIFLDSQTGEQIKNEWPQIAETLVRFFGRIDQRELQKTTLVALMKSVLGEGRTHDLCSQFAYWSELFTMRADLALDSIGSEMGTDSGFCVAGGGLSQLTQAMAEEARDRGVEILLGWRLIGISDKGDTARFQVTHNIPFAQGREVAKEIRNLSLAPEGRIVLGLHSEALKKIPPFTNLPVLKKIKMEPLLRTYAVFSSAAGKKFVKNLPRTVTDSPIRYIIPINPKRGVVMISYTDGADADKWLRLLDAKGEEKLELAIMKEIRRLFPDQTIPDPEFFKAHPWYEGCSYWLPGLYDVQTESEKIMQPFPKRLPRVFVCGESFSPDKQCWMEGALEHAEAMLRSVFFAQ
jgi:monoamine oxidase